MATLCSASVFAAEQKPEMSDLFELRTYTLKPARQPVLDEYLSRALLPALKRQGAGPVGVFTEAPEKDVMRETVLIVHHNGESALTWQKRLGADEEYARAAAAYLSAKTDDPVYQRIDSSLLAAIPGMPKLDRPDTSKPRLFNLRVYESHNERAATKKVEMFEKGELAVFRKVGLTPVFFSSALIGAAMPNLTYMLVFPDETGRKAAWDKFRVDPDWQKLRAIPEYADKEIVSRITNRILTPTAFSEV